MAKLQSSFGSAGLRAAAGLWAPMLVLVLISEHSAWLFRRFVALPGLMPATALGAKASDWALALGCTTVLAGLMTLVVRKHRLGGVAASVLTGTLSALWLHAAGQA